MNLNLIIVFFCQSCSAGLFCVASQSLPLQLDTLSIISHLKCKVLLNAKIQMITNEINLNLIQIWELTHKFTYLELIQYIIITLSL